VIADDEALFFLYKEVPLYVTTKLDGTADIPQTDDSSSPIHSVRILVICVSAHVL
jgi:hypothetical protein